MKLLKYYILLLSGICLFFCSCNESSESDIKYGEPVKVELKIEFKDYSNIEVLKDSKSAKLRAGVDLSNIWVLQFDSTSLQCDAVYYAATFNTSDDKLNPTLLTGTNKVIYIIANGPAEGTISKTTYTLSTFKNSADFASSITDESKIPYLGRIQGGTTINSSGKISSPGTVALSRIAARVGLKLYFNIDGYTLESVKMYNKPVNMYYLNGSSTTIFPATPSSSNINSTPVNSDIIPSDLNNGTYVWFTGENKRGTNNAITTYTDKDIDHTPSGSVYCSYIRILARKVSSSKYYTYDLFLGTNETKDFNLKRNWYYEYIVNLKGNESVQDYWDSVDGRINKSVETANCYMIAPGKSLTIPVNIKGNGNTSTIESGINVNHTVTSMSIFWQAGHDLLTLSDFNAVNQTVKINASSQSGNAVIAAYNGIDIVWSWHIWITDYNPNSTGTIYTFTNYLNNTNVFMDRNLGAMSTTYSSGSDELYYQFGRKDPLLISTVGNFNPSNTSSSMANSIKKPSTYYFAGNGSDWCSTVSGEWWMGIGGSETTPGKKTIYDPCPAGWRVPPFTNGGTPWQNATKSALTNGVVVLSGLGNYVANGKYDYSFSSTGSMNITSKGSMSYCWTANKYWGDNYSGNTLDLSLGNSIVGRINRSNAVPVRCVKE